MLTQSCGVCVCVCTCRWGQDEKVVVSWNAQLMSALAKASTALHEPAYLRLARGIATHIRTTLFDEQTAALRRLSFQGVASEVPAMADDYGFLVRGLIDLYEATGDADLLRWAKRLQVSETQAGTQTEPGTVRSTESFGITTAVMEDS